MKQWYYAVDKERIGPISEAEFEDLKRQNVITASTLVWTAGMEKWVSLSEMEAQVASQPGLVISTNQARCVHSNRVYEKANMFQYGVHWVANEHREAFLQSLREGRVLPTREASTAGVVYGGFWWRFLGTILDGMVTGLISCLITFPLMFILGGIFAATTSKNLDSDNVSALDGFNIIFNLISYVLGFVINLAYETIMVGGKNESTLGKMALGFKVTRPDFTKVSYGRAAWRSFCKQLINTVCSFVVIGLYLGIGVLMIGVENIKNIDGDFAEGMPTSMVVYLCFFPVVMLLAAFPYWMAAFSPEKAALHDRIAGTRVIRR